MYGDGCLVVRYQSAASCRFSGGAEFQLNKSVPGGSMRFTVLTLVEQEKARLSKRGQNAKRFRNKAPPSNF